jgi:hypothetical protein
MEQADYNTHVNQEELVLVIYKLQNETPALGVVECKIQELQGSILRQEGSSPN